MILCRMPSEAAAVGRGIARHSAQSTAAAERSRLACLGRCHTEVRVQAGRAARIAAKAPMA
eukprot:6960050-Prymnesium_polylepis.1